MLSLFKELDLPLNKMDSMCRARELIISFLNKGTVPTWETFSQELPSAIEAADLFDIKTYFNQMTKWGFLQEALNEQGTEFFFHTESNCQRLTLVGEKKPFSIPILGHDWQLWLEILSVKFQHNWNVENPFASFYGELFGKTYRITLIHESTSPCLRSKLVLRCLAQKPHDLKLFGDSEGLVDLVKQSKNILIAGSTGSGKTSILTSLLEFIPREEHLLILEDTFEILSSHPNQTRFLSGSTPQTSLKSYLSYSLRLSPDRIILGEMRSHEVIPFLMAMNTGHKGLMGTIHASSAADALNRVALLFTLYAGEANLAFEKVMELICRNLEYVVFMENKKVKEVIRILGSDKGIPFFEGILNQDEKRFF